MLSVLSSLFPSFTASKASLENSSEKPGQVPELPRSIIYSLEQEWWEINFLSFKFKKIKKATTTRPITNSIKNIETSSENREGGEGNGGRNRSDFQTINLKNPYFSELANNVLDILLLKHNHAKGKRVNYIPYAPEYFNRLHIMFFWRASCSFIYCLKHKHKHEVSNPKVVITTFA